jgi:hypothetical protein
MINWSFYLQTWVVPMLTVGMIYLFFLIPTYFLVKKYKPSYWLMITLGALIVYLIDLTFFIFSVKSNSNYFLLNLYFLSFFTNFLFFIFIPIFIRKFLSNKIKFNLIITYLILFIIQIIHGYLLLVSIAWGASSIIN